MADYVGEYEYKYLADGQPQFKGYKIVHRIGDPDCPYESIETLPRWLMGFHTELDEPVSAVAWSADKGVYLKPEAERGYELQQISWYPQLRDYLVDLNPVMTQLLLCICAQYPIKPAPACYNSIKDALDATNSPPNPTNP